ncbi:CoA-binding domain protein [Syntrophobacter sp. SbD1]|nr:CoA-binding domain protein [Syntrophobacter sp. SbD1]
MSIKNLEFLLKPSSVALIGASTRPHSVGAVILKNLVGSGFKGDIFLVNPRHRTMEGLPVYPSAASLPKPPDLAVIAVPPDSVPAVTAEVGARGAKAAVVITVGLGEGGSQHGLNLRRAMLDAAQRYSLRIIGPNCLGIMAPGSCLNASMAHISPLPGHIAFISQSGALQTAMMDWATSQNIGFSHLVSLGSMADVDFGDILDYLSTDITNHAILIYMEGITDARKFMSAARAAARMKPVIVFKAGRNKEAAEAAATHTGMAPGIDAVYGAAFRRAGMLRVYDLRSLFSAVETLAKMPGTLRGHKLAILTNGGGVGVLAADALIDEGGDLAGLSSETVRGLNAVLPSIWSQRNPVDIRSDAPADRYAKALEILLKDEIADGVLVLNSPYAVASGKEVAQAVIDTIKSHGSPHPAVLTSWLGGACTAESRSLFVQNHIPTYETPADAVRAFMQMIRYRRNQEMLMETPPSIPESFTPDIVKARRVIDNALAQGRGLLTTDEAYTLLDAYTIPTPLQRWASLGPAKTEPGLPVPHEPSVHRSGAHKLMIEAFDDVQFGPVIRLGFDITGAEFFHKTEFALPPLSLNLAKELIARVLTGYTRSLGAMEIEDLALTLMKVSQIISDIDEIAEFNIHSLLDLNGILAVNTRIRVIKSSALPGQRMAIRPYPKELETALLLPDGMSFQVRPIRPEDEPIFQTLFSGLSANEIRMRFLHPMGTLSHSQAARLTQIDYDREMGLVIATPAEAREQELYAHVQLLCDPDNERAEFSILVRSSLSGKGLGRMLMQRIISYARSRGIKEIFGDVLTENRAMLRLAETLGFTSRFDPEDPGSLIVSLKL